MKISIAMACYNTKPFIFESVKSIVEQTFNNWEIIFVDDCSTDGSLREIKKVCNSFGINDRVTIYMNDKNRGYGYTLDRAIKMSTGSIVAIVDSDDALAIPTALKICAKAHNRNPDIAMTYTNYWECDSSLTKKKLYVTRQIPAGRMYLDGGIRVSHLKVLKKAFYDKTDGINPEVRQAVDKELTLRMEETGKLLYLNQDLYLYRQHNQNLTKSFSNKSKDYKKSIVNMRKQIFEDAKKRRNIC